MPEEKDLREEIIDRMRKIAQSIRLRNIEGFILGVKYKDQNEDGTGNMMMMGDPVVEMAMAGRMMGIVLDDLFKIHKEDPKIVLGMFMQSLIEGSAIHPKSDDPDKKKIEDSIKGIKMDEDLRKKLGEDVPGIDDLLEGK